MKRVYIILCLTLNHGLRPLLLCTYHRYLSPPDPRRVVTVPRIFMTLFNSHIPMPAWQRIRASYRVLISPMASLTEFDPIKTQGGARARRSVSQIKSNQRLLRTPRHPIITSLPRHRSARGHPRRERTPLLADRGSRPTGTVFSW